MVNQRHTSLSVVFVDSRLLNEVSGVTNSGRHDMNSWRPIEKPHTRRRMPRPTTPRDAPSAMEELSISENEIIRSISHASLTLVNARQGTRMHQFATETKQRWKGEFAASGGPQTVTKAVDLNR